jgi:multiple sugar transport system permease protein
VAGVRLSGRERLLLVAPVAVILAIWLVVPALIGLAAALTDYAPGQRSVQWVGLRNFELILADRTFANAARNLAVFTVVAVPIELAAGVGLACLLRRPFRGRAAVRLLLLLPWLVSPVASGVMWHFLLDGETGFLNFAARSLGLQSQPSPLGQHGLALAAVILVEAWRVAPLVTFIVLPGLMGIPRERWDDARLDGLDGVGRIRHVVLPATRQLLLAVTMLLVGGALATFDGVVTMTGGGPGTETLTPALYSYDKAFAFGNWPLGAAAGWLIGGAVLLAGFIYVRLAARWVA